MNELREFVANQEGNNLIEELIEIDQGGDAYFKEGSALEILTNIQGSNDEIRLSYLPFVMPKYWNAEERGEIMEETITTLIRIMFRSEDSEVKLKAHEMLTLHCTALDFGLEQVDAFDDQEFGDKGIFENTIMGHIIALLTYEKDRYTKMLIIKRTLMMLELRGEQSQQTRTSVLFGQLEVKLPEIISTNTFTIAEFTQIFPHTYLPHISRSLICLLMNQLVIEQGRGQYAKQDGWYREITNFLVGNPVHAKLFYVTVINMHIKASELSQSQTQ